MSNSVTTSYEWLCTRCHETRQRSVWKVISSAEFPEQLSGIALGVTHVRCPSCGDIRDIESEILVLRPGADLPILHAYDPTVEPSTGPERLRDLVAAIGGWPDDNGIFPPAVPIARPLLPIVLTRPTIGDLDRIDDAAAHVREVHGADLGHAYRWFLISLAESSADRAAVRAVHRVFNQVDPLSLAQCVVENPEIGGPEALAELQSQWNSWQPDTEGAQIAGARLQLARDIAKGVLVEDAVADYFEFLSSLGQGLRERLRVLVDVASGSDADESEIREALTFARALGDPVEPRLCLMLGKKLIQQPMTTGAAAESHALLSQAVAELDQDDPAWVDAASCLASQLADNPIGDVRDSWVEACQLMKEAISKIREPSWDAEDDRDALLCTNYSYVLTREPGGPTAEGLALAIELAEHALRFRSVEDNPVDWGYSQVNLGSLYQSRGAAGDFETAESGYRNALSQLTIDDDAYLWIRLRCNLATCVTARQDIDGANLVLKQTLQQARDHDARPNILSDLISRLADATGDVPTRVALLEEAVGLLEPHLDADEILSVGGKLVETYATEGRWDDAAAIYDFMLIANDSLYQAALTRDEQRRVLAGAPTLARWAAYTFARVGRTRDAIETLEQFRTRELNTATSRDEIDIARLGEVHPDLASAFTRCVRQYRDALAGSSGLTPSVSERERVAAVERELRVLRDAIRQIAGFEDFQCVPRLEEYFHFLGTEWQIAYVVCAPPGTYVLSLHADASGSVYVDSLHVGDVTSRDVAFLVVGNSETWEPGLLVAQTIHDEQALSSALDRLDKLQPIAAALTDAERFPLSRKLAVIPTGLLGYLPLYALNITMDTDISTAVDDQRLLYLSHSASALARSVQRSKRSARSHLVALANPTSDLLGTEAEVHSTAALFEQVGDVPDIALRADATRAWLLANAPDATHLHLGCHGASEIANAAGAFVVLSDGPASMDDFASHQPLAGRLAVASACQTAHYAAMTATDEMLGLPAGLKMAGYACVVASLWPVGDYETALLMTRFYELLEVDADTSAQTPVEAMRGARTWLRNLSAAEADEFVSNRPALDTALRSAGVRRSVPASRRLESTPFSDARSWAAFVVYGV